MNNIICSDAGAQMSYALSKKKVLGSNGGYYNVGIARVTRDPRVTTIRAKGCVELSVGSNQQILVLRKGVRKWVEATKVKTGDMVGFPLVPGGNLPKWDHDDVVSKSLDKPELWWIAGRYVADGWTVKDGRTIIAVGPSKDDDIERLQSLGESRQCSMHSCTAVTLTNKGYHRFFEKMFGTGAQSKFISEDVFKLPPELLRAFVEGYLRGDGYFAQGKYTAKTVSIDLALGLVRAIAKAYGRPAYITEYKTPGHTVIKGKRYKCRSAYYAVAFSPDIVRKRENHLLEKGFMWMMVTKATTSTENLSGPHLTIISSQDSFVCNNVTMRG